MNRYNKPHPFSPAVIGVREYHGDGVGERCHFVRYPGQDEVLLDSHDDAVAVAAVFKHQAGNAERAEYARQMEMATGQPYEMA